MDQALDHPMDRPVSAAISPSGVSARRSARRRLAPSFVASLVIHLGGLAASAWIVHRHVSEPPAERLQVRIEPAQPLPERLPEPVEMKPPARPPQPPPVAPLPNLRKPTPAAAVEPARSVELPPPEKKPIEATTEPAPTASKLVAPPPPEPPPAASPEPSKSEPPRPEPAKPAATTPLVPATGSAGYLNNPKPAYPERARRQRLEGTVVLAVVVSVDGAPKNVKVARSSGTAVLDTAAVDAVSRWRFRPARRGDEPVESTVEFPIEFRIEE